MRAVLAIAGISLREAWRGSLLILIPIYAAFLLWVLNSYPAVDEAAHLRQALSFGHGALHVGVGLICLLFGVTTIATDRLGRQVERATATPLGRWGYVLGKGCALGATAICLAFSLGGIEALLLRASFRDRPQMLGVRPLLRESLFEILPDRPAQEGEIRWIEADRLSWRFGPPGGDRLLLEGLDIGTESLPGVRLRLRSPGLGRSEVLTQGLTLPLDLPLPDWARGLQGADLWVDLLHASGSEVRIAGDPRSACRLGGAGGERRPLEVSGILDRRGEGESLFRPQSAVWTYPAALADRADGLALRPIVQGTADGRLPLKLVLRRGDVREELEFTAEDRRKSAFPIPGEVREGAGELVAELTLRYPEGALGIDSGDGPDGSPRSGLYLTAPPIAQEWNLLMGALAAALLGILLGAAGMAASLVFSAPVALFAGLALTVLGLGAGLFQDLPEPTLRNDPLTEVFGFERSPSPELVHLAEKASLLVPDLKRFDLQAAIVSAHAVPSGRVAGLLVYALIVATLFLGVGGLVFTRKGSP